jgi:hypothetical protein
MVRRKNLELAKLAETGAREAQQLLGNAKRAVHRARKKAADLAANGGKDAAAGRRRGRLVRAVDDLTELLDATRQIAAQTRQRLAGTMPDGATRRVSLHDPDARPLRKGRFGKPVEFRPRAQVCDNADGIVLDYDLQPGNPPDAPQLKPAVERVIKRTKRKPPHRRCRSWLRRSRHRRTAPRHRRPERRDPRKGKPGQARQSPPETPQLPTQRQMADRIRGPDQSPETQLQLEPHHDPHHRRRPHLDRTPIPHPQRHQDRHPDRLSRPAAGPNDTRPDQLESADPNASDFFRSK